MHHDSQYEESQRGNENSDIKNLSVSDSESGKASLAGIALGALSALAGVGISNYLSEGEKAIAEPLPVSRTFESEDSGRLKKQLQVASAQSSEPGGGLRLPARPDMIEEPKQSERAETRQRANPVESSSLQGNDRSISQWRQGPPFLRRVAAPHADYVSQENIDMPNGDDYGIRHYAGKVDHELVTRHSPLCAWRVNDRSVILGEEVLPNGMVKTYHGFKLSDERYRKQTNTHRWPSLSAVIAVWDSTPGTHSADLSTATEPRLLSMVIIEDLSREGDYVSFSMVHLPKSYERLKQIELDQRRKSLDPDLLKKVWFAQFGYLGNKIVSAEQRQEITIEAVAQLRAELEATQRTAHRNLMTRDQVGQAQQHIRVEVEHSISGNQQALAFLNPTSPLDVVNMMLKSHELSETETRDYMLNNPALQETLAGWSECLSFLEKNGWTKENVEILKKGTEKQSVDGRTNAAGVSAAATYMGILFGSANFDHTNEKQRIERVIDMLEKRTGLTTTFDSVQKKLVPQSLKVFSVRDDINMARVIENSKVDIIVDTSESAICVPMRTDFTEEVLNDHLEKDKPKQQAEFESKVKELEGKQKELSNTYKAMQQAQLTVNAHKVRETGRAIQASWEKNGIQNGPVMLGHGGLSCFRNGYSELEKQKLPDSYRQHEEFYKVNTGFVEGVHHIHLEQLDLLFFDAQIGLPGSLGYELSPAELLRNPTQVERILGRNISDAVSIEERLECLDILLAKAERELDLHKQHAAFVQQRANDAPVIRRDLAARDQELRGLYDSKLAKEHSDREAARERAEVEKRKDRELKEWRRRNGYDPESGEKLPSRPRSGREPGDGPRGTDRR